MTTPSSTISYPSSSVSSYGMDPMYSLNHPFCHPPTPYFISEQNLNLPPNKENDEMKMETNDDSQIGCEQMYMFYPVNSNSLINSRKRHSGNEIDGPLCKRKVENVSARLEHIHISNESKLINKNRMKEYAFILKSDFTVYNLSHVWTFSASSENLEETYGGNNGGLLIVDEKIRRYIQNEHKLCDSFLNSSSMAVVPYVPLVSLSNQGMIGRIKEIDIDDDNYDEECVSSDNGLVSFPDDPVYLHSADIENVVAGNSNSLSPALQVTEMFIDDDKMEID
ncbi:unnamed protein product [Thelazia callipaeda]|uniref:IBD domain-containing protein n=1 Tax=Thelazia callipaeda TaxID=103827 RepID=A0A0N5CLM1_THECL|nr:unnamed protein product [Thelazia callipaeda]